MPMTTRASHAQRGASGLESLDRMYRTNQTANTPSPYPIAPPAPLTRPWNRGPRGSSDGVIEAHRNNSPTAVPKNV